MDILDEILLLQARQSSRLPSLTNQGNPPQHHQYQQCQYVGGENNPAGAARKVVVPSPRGIQDAYFDFMPEEPPASSTTLQPYASSSPVEAVPVKALSSHTQLSPFHIHNANAEIEPPSFAPTSLTICPPQFAAESITPWIEDASSSGGGNDESASASTRYYDDDDQDGSGSTLHVDQRNKTPSSRVMPPTAKSILERRERALREGRRNEARLNDEERRILRRLRNRESADRCARRKHEQAQLMSMKIENLENENNQLRSLAQEYEAEIAKLEKVLWQRRGTHGNP
jgi:hypothetical protein